MKIRGFQIEIDAPWSKYWEARNYEWRIKKNYINSHVEFGASPIRDKRSMNTYMECLKSHGLDFTVYAIQ
jgi:hypothetical protein